VKVAGFRAMRPVLPALAGAAILLAAAAWGAGEAAAQLSPGPLAEAHRDLDRTAACFQCHARGGKSQMDQRCLDCHTEVSWLRERGRGLHGREARAECASCHPDHAGREFQMIRWEEGSPEGFDHARAGWTLEGKHAETECRDCHQPKFQRSAAAAQLRRKDRGKSWLGLETACASCHEDVHRGQLGDDCARCHDVRAFRPAPGFDHERTRYPLTGRHAEVECARCHLAPTLALAHDAQGKPIAQYRPLPYQECTPCHRDPHAARFGPRCASCHDTRGFHSINARGFDHNLTRYPLRGKHAAVACEKCHDAKTAWGKKPPFANCGSCHRDAHAGQATVAGRAADCAACHGVVGFRPSTFTVAQHAASTYPLEKAHTRAECAGCHVRRGPQATAELGPARVVMRPAAARCQDCHADPHRGRFEPGSRRARAGGCRACHGMEVFRPSLYDAAAHSGSGFALDGAHRATPCQMCHAELKSTAPSSTLRSAAARRAVDFTDASSRCTDCHASPHGDQFAGRRDRGACESCHDVARFAPAVRFDHDRQASFALDGAHARAACGSCHRSVKDASGRARVIYRPLSGRCETCHSAAPAARSRAPGGGT
jgi:hypothetical protein